MTHFDIARCADEIGGLSKGQIELPASPTVSIHGQRRLHRPYIYLCLLTAASPPTSGEFWSMRYDRHV